MRDVIKMSNSAVDMVKPSVSLLGIALLSEVITFISRHIYIRELNEKL